MSNLKLVPDAPTPLEKLLLDAARAELPSADHKARLRAALGIGAPWSGPVTVTSAAGSAPAAPPAASLPPPAVGVAKSGAALKLAAGAGALAAAYAAWLLWAPPAEPGSAPPQALSAPSVAARPVAARPVAAPPVEPAPSVQQEAAAPSEAAPPSAVVEVSPAPKQKAPAASASADLSEQIRLIEAARAGLAARDSRAALRALDSYASQFPRGSFGQEALVLRIRALDQAGDSARATAMAKSFVARYPASPHVARLKPIAERGASR